MIILIGYSGSHKIKTKIDKALRKQRATNNGRKICYRTKMIQ